MITTSRPTYRTRLVYIGGTDDRETLELKIAPHHIGDVQLIFDYQDIPAHVAAPRYCGARSIVE